LRYASDELKYNKDFLIVATKYNYKIYNYIKFEADDNFIIRMLKANILSYT